MIFIVSGYNKKERNTASSSVRFVIRNKPQFYLKKKERNSDIESISTCFNHWARDAYYIPKIVISIGAGEDNVPRTNAFSFITNNNCFVC